MDDLQQYLITTQENLYNASGGVGLEQIKKDLEELHITLNTTDIRDSMFRLNDEIKDSLGMIKFINNKLRDKPATEPLYKNVVAKIRDVETKIDEILSKRYIKTEENMYMEIDKEQTWKILGDIFSIFIKTKEEFDKISRSTEPYDIVSAQILNYIRNVNDSLKMFMKTLEKLLKSFEDAIHVIRKSIYGIYEIDDITFVGDNIKIPKEQYQVTTKYDSKITELVIGYDGIILDAIHGIVGNAFNKLQLSRIEETYLPKLNTINERLQPLISKKYDGIQIGGNKHEEVIKYMYTFNIELQRVQKILMNVVNKWKEYQHMNHRFNNYFMYQIYCLTIPVSGKNQINYVYIDSQILQEYKNILDNIIQKFNNFGQITDPDDKNAIIYFNKYHYFTIKKLNKFLNFIIQNSNNKVIDIRKCKKDVYQTFLLFNQFKNIVDVYNEVLTHKK